MTINTELSLSDNINNLLSSLNPEQKEVVTHSEGPMLVLAGAGSGKTRCIVNRVAWLISEKKIKPWNILIVTFTNKAASELKERLESVLHNKIDVSWVGTFHSICTRILRYEIKNYLNYKNHIFYENLTNELPEDDFCLKAYKPGFTIFDRENQLSLLKQIYKIRNIDKKDFPVEKMLNLISRKKSELIQPADIKKLIDENKHQDKQITKLELLYLVYKTYNDMLIVQNAMDFDDILLNTVMLLEKHSDIKDKYQELFKYILIDEYQDTNKVQFMFINLIAEKYNNICVVGDDDQSIYGWRGANIENILNFSSNYAKVKTVKLERNYRSSEDILNIANQLIRKNKNRHEKVLWSENKSTFKPQLLSHSNEYEEANYIAKNLIQRISDDSDISYKDIAVLYRINSLSRVIESIFTSFNIPYQIIGGFSFYQRSEIKDLLAYFRFLVNPEDLESFIRIVNIPARGIGKTSIDHIIKYIHIHQVSITEALMNIEQIDGLKKNSIKSLTQFNTLIFSLRKLIDDNQKEYLSDPNSTKKLSSTVKQIINKLDLIEYYSNLDIKNMTEKTENIREFISASADFESKYFVEYRERATVVDFINSLSLVSDVDQYKQNSDSVTLMTIHCAKGLEFDTVYIAGIEDGILPHNMSMFSEKEIEEERRLLYVAITRAKNYLQLHYSQSRRVAGSYQYCKKSRFLNDLTIPDFKMKQKHNSALYNNIIQTDTKIDNMLTPKKDADDMYTQSYGKNCVFKNNQIVFHQKYGEGKILTIEEAGDDVNLTVSFDSGELKKVKGKWVSDVQI